MHLKRFIEQYRGSSFPTLIETESGEYFVLKMTNAGGMEFKTPMGLIISANITPDGETGIGNWTKEQFIARFKAYSDISKLDQPKQGEKQSVMPWNMYAQMSEDELAALYDYLMTFKIQLNH